MVAAAVANGDAPKSIGELVNETALGMGVQADDLKIINRLARAERWSAADLVTKLNATIPQLGKRAPADGGAGGGVQRHPAGHPQPGSSRPAKLPIAPSNTGAPIQQGGAGPSLPSNPHEWPDDVIAKLSPHEAREALRAHRKSLGMFVHPFEGIKRPHER